jgi:Carboxypeptidase regulatory-like domain/TonB dependent receptor-like, beta-barrel
MIWDSRDTKRLMLFLTAGLVLLNPRVALPQANTATLHGTVTDPSGAVISGARITLTNDATRAVMTQESGTGGEYVFPFVPPASYTARIEAAGFKTLTVAEINLSAGQQARLTNTLELGQITDSVKVEGTASLVNTVSAEQLKSYQPGEMKELPLQNRNFTRILILTTGAVPSTGSATGVNMNGIGTNGTQWSLDGTNASGNTGANSPGVYQAPNLVDIMSVEGIQEVSAVKGVIPAEYENAIGGQVNLISKSGTNQWHGSVFENHRNRALNARLQTLSSKAPLTFNQFGGSLGGPIKKDKIFLFGDYEGYREREGVFVQGNVPTDGVRAQLLAAVPAYKMTLDAFPRPNQPAAPNATVGLFNASQAGRRDDDHVDAKGDVLFTSNSRLAVTYNHGIPLRIVPSIYIDNDRFWNNNLDRFSIGHTMTKTRFVSETRFGYTRATQTRGDAFFNHKDPSHPEEEFTGARSIPMLATGIGFSGPTTEANKSGGPLYSVSQKFARSSGRHFLKFGGNYNYLTGTRNNPQNPSLFYPTLDSLLRNAPSTATVTFGNGDFSMRTFGFGAFFQDDFRVTPKLTLNLGLRYDFYSNFRSVGKAGTAAAGLHNPSSMSMDGAFTVGAFSPVDKPFNHDPLNLGPRIGFAYNPDGAGKTAIRGGFGTMFTPNTAEVGWFATAIAPNIPSRQELSPADISRFGVKFPMFNADFLQQVQILAQEAGAKPSNVFQIFNQDLQAPYTMQFSFDVQRQLSNTMVLNTGFVGTRGVKLTLFRSANRVDRITGVRPNPGLSQPVYSDNSQTLSYYSWQSSLKKRFSNRLSFDVSYTWSKALGTAAGDFGAWFTGENSNTLNQEFFDLRSDYGPTAYDLKHFFTGAWVYEAPGLTSLQNGFARAVLGGWQISGILRANTGLPVTVTQTSSIPGQRGDFIGGGPVKFENYRDTLQYLNPAVFQLIPVSAASGAPIRPGNVGRGSIREPGLWNLDFSLAKAFRVPIREAGRLQLRADMFNSLNHTSLTGLRTSRNDSFFGRLLSTRGSRLMQVGAVLSF